MDECKRLQDSAPQRADRGIWHEPGAAKVLPCSEYFDDRCVGTRRALLALRTSNKTQFLQQPVKRVGTSLRAGVVQWPSNSCLTGSGNWSNRSSQSPRRSPKAG